MKRKLAFNSFMDFSHRGETYVRSVTTTREDPGYGSEDDYFTESFGDVVYRRVRTRAAEAKELRENEITRLL